MSEIYATFVLEGGLDPEYVLDKMQLYEVQTLLKNWNIIHRESWEQTRWMTWRIMNMLCKENIKITDILKFPWDDETKEEVKYSDNTHVSDDDVQRLIERAKRFEKHI